MDEKEYFKKLQEELEDKEREEGIILDHLRYHRAEGTATRRAAENQGLTLEEFFGDEDKQKK